MTKPEDMAQWLETVTADDFKPQPRNAHQEAWNHLWEGSAILFREGYTAAAIIQMLGDVMEGFEDTGDLQLEVD